MSVILTPLSWILLVNDLCALAHNCSAYLVKYLGQMFFAVDRVSAGGVNYDTVLFGMVFIPWNRVTKIVIGTYALCSVLFTIVSYSRCDRH